MKNSSAKEDISIVGLIKMKKQCGGKSHTVAPDNGKCRTHGNSSLRGGGNAEVIDVVPAAPVETRAFA